MEKRTAFTTYIDSMDPSDGPVSCEFPNVTANRVSILGNYQIVIQAHKKILIVDKSYCFFKVIHIKSYAAVISQDSFFTILINSPEQNKAELIFKGSLSAQQYDDHGKLGKEFLNFTRQRGELVHQGQFIDKLDGKDKYFLIQDISKHSNHWGLVDIFNYKFEKVDSKLIEPYPKAYSTAHDRFSICYEEYGLECTLYDETFRQLYKINVIRNSSEVLDNYKFVNVHNLVNGSLLVTFCQKISDTTCRLYCAVSDERGQLFQNRYFDFESLYTDDAFLKPFFMDINSIFKPRIFELHAKNSIYCLVFPHNGSLHGVAISLKDLLRSTGT
ncbi:hypothetical protein QAD02_006656 [Eretmocerus hayati]|uniref:Uncharacterized protein n=1 Tax=Eretmocerus hayati TaxID=131215 RepID=A0ACC2N1R8_9HYME|nr:hypothetical protein QAD02_006656 [Eretmocerus hayati]